MALTGGSPGPILLKSTMGRETYDRRGQDVGNIVALEHVNLRIPDQLAATAFYVLGLGLTRDPYLWSASTTCGST